MSGPPDIARRACGVRDGGCAVKYWSPPVVTYSALTREGIAPLWAAVMEHRARMTPGELAGRRRAQQDKWMWAMLEDRVAARLRSDPGFRAKLPRLEAAVGEGGISAALAVEELATALGI
jgi:GTPase